MLESRHPWVDRHRPLRAYVPSLEGSKPELMNGFADTRDEPYPRALTLLRWPLIWEQNEIGWGGGEGGGAYNICFTFPCIASGGGS